jgi:hypothetical protein
MRVSERLFLTPFVPPTFPRGLEEPLGHELKHRRQPQRSKLASETSRPAFPEAELSGS